MQIRILRINSAGKEVRLQKYTEEWKVRVTTINKREKSREDQTTYYQGNINTMEYTSNKEGMWEFLGGGSAEDRKNEFIRDFTQLLQ